VRSAEADAGGGVMGSCFPGLGGSKGHDASEVELLINGPDTSAPPKREKALADPSVFVQKVRRLGREILSYRPKCISSAITMGGNGIAASIADVWWTNYNKFDVKHVSQRLKSIWNKDEKSSPETQAFQRSQCKKSEEKVANLKLRNLGVSKETLKPQPEKAGMNTLEGIVKGLFAENNRAGLIGLIQTSFKQEDFVRKALGDDLLSLLPQNERDEIKAILGGQDASADDILNAVHALIKAKENALLNLDALARLVNSKESHLTPKEQAEFNQALGGLPDGYKNETLGSFNDLKKKKEDSLDQLNKAKNALGAAEDALFNNNKKDYHRWVSDPGATLDVKDAAKFKNVRQASGKVEVARAEYKNISTALDLAAMGLKIGALYKAFAELKGAHDLCTHAQAQVAMACATVFDGKADAAAEALRNLDPQSGVTTNLSSGRNGGKQLELRCALAKTPQGFDALLHLEGLTGLNVEQKLAYKSFLEVAGFLNTEFRKNVFPANKISSIQGLLNEAQNWTRYNPDSPIGASNDRKYQLACQALLYSAAKLGNVDTEQYVDAENFMPKGQLDELKRWVAERKSDIFNNPRLINTCRGGYIAWCNGFTTSGHGSDFDKAMNHLFKFRTQYRRATSHGDRTALNLLKDLGRQLRKTFLGQKKDPLMGLVSTGHMGAGWHLRQQEMFQNSEAMLKGGALPVDPFGQERPNWSANESVLGQLKTQLEAQVDPKKKEKLEARAKVIAYWMTQGGRNLRVKVGDTINGDTLTSKDLKAAFNRSFLMFRRNPKLHLRTLEKWAVGAYGLEKGEWKKSIRELEASLGSDALAELKKEEINFFYGDTHPPENNKNIEKNQKNSSSLRAAKDEGPGRAFLIRVAKLRQLANGGRVAGKDRGNLFQFRDLLNIVTGRTPRKTVDGNMLRETLIQYMEGDEVGHSVDSHSFGFDIGSPINVGAGPLGGFGGLIGHYSKGKESFITWGDGSHGSEAIFGEMNRTRWEIGIRGGLSIAKLDKFLKVGPFGSWSFGKDTGKGAAFVALIPQDRNPTKDMDKNYAQKHSKYIASQFTDFLVDFAKQDKGEESIQTKSDLWASFCKDSTISDPTRMGIGLRKFSYDSKLKRTELGLSARVKWGSRYYGPVVGGTVIKAKGVDSRNDKVGRFQVTRSTVFNEVTAMVSAALSMGGETVHTGEEFSLSTRAIPGIGAGVQLALKTSNAITKLCMENGRVIAAETNRDMVFANARDLMRHLNDTDPGQAKSVWLDMVTANGALSAKFDSWDNKTKSFSSVEEAERALQAFIDNAHSGVAFDSNAYTTRQVLHPEAAKELTHLFSSAQVQEQLLEKALEKGSDVSKLVESLTAINQRVVNILDDQSSWLNKWSTVAATVSKSNAFSVNAGAFFQSRQSVSSRPKSSRIFFTGAQRDEMAYARTFHNHVAAPAV
jgi:hypothetical protein